MNKDIYPQEVDFNYKIRCDKHVFRPYIYCEMCKIRNTLQDIKEDTIRKVKSGKEINPGDKRMRIEMSLIRNTGNCKELVVVVLHPKKEMVDKKDKPYYFAFLVPDDKELLVKNIEKAVNECLELYLMDKENDNNAL